MSDKPGGPHRKPKTDIYTVLLGIALTALLIAIVMLYLELNMYEWKHSGGPTVSANHPTTVAAADRQATGTGRRHPDLGLNPCFLCSFAPDS
ncbi:MAG: hypothetical protein A2V70_01450 [Planctomycetes bacterium RBG_13_63_9]|nr:MAG: hypothetical protein A2V70_01450 [Planctomycetes bacterium RBG_13_63_9]